MSELLPCPFCGGEATIEVKTEWYDYDGGDRWWIYQADVTCDSCDAMMHVNHYKPRNHTDWATAEQFAVEAWNTRYVQDDGWEYDKRSVPATEENMAKFGWVRERTCENVGYYIDDTRFKCSECGYNGWTKWVKDGEDRIPNYCPNCGAKVRNE